MPKNVIMPALGVAQETGRVVQWLKAEGELIRQGEPLLEIETDKAIVELEAPSSGVLRNVSAVAGDDVTVGTVIASIWDDDEVRDADSGAAPKDQVAVPGADNRRAATVSETSILPPTAENSCAQGSTGVATAEPVTNQRNRMPASPKARRLAAERGIDLRNASGSGPAGAVVAANLLQVPEDRKAVSRIWRVMAERMGEAWRTIPHFYLVREVDAVKLVEWRQALRGRFSEPVTYTDLLVKKVAAALRSHADVNSQWHDGTVQRHSDINIGLAVAVDAGLVVPVIRNADQLDIPKIAAERTRLVEKAQSVRLSPDDISAGTFTISNLGMYGVDSFQAIVNPPQAAILAVGRIAQRVVALDGQPVVRPMVTLSLSCDHRAVDGARAARFLGDLAASLEQASSSEI